MTRWPTGLRTLVWLLGPVAVLALLSGCTKPPGAREGPGVYKVGKPYQVAGQWYYPRVDYAYREKGLASWYGPNFHGKPTANGEIFDMNKVSAAHKTLPLPSVVRVTNLENGRSLVVRVNDRGPFIRGRIIDVSKKAAELLGFTEQGTALVEVQLVVESSLQAALAMGAAEHPNFGPAPPKAAPSIDVTIENLDPKAEAETPAPRSPRPRPLTPATELCRSPATRSIWCRLAQRRRSLSRPARSRSMKTPTGCARGSACSAIRCGFTKCISPTSRCSGCASGR